MLSVVPDPAAGDDRPGSSGSLIDELVRQGAQRMLAEAVQAEVEAYLARFREEVDEHGHRLVVRNGYHQPRGNASNSATGSDNPRTGPRAPRLDADTCGNTSAATLRSPKAITAPQATTQRPTAAAPPANAAYPHSDQ